MENFFIVISSKYLYFKLLENAKRTVIYFWYKGFVHLKLRLLDLLSDFVFHTKQLSKLNRTI